MRSRGVTGREHWVQQENPSIGNVFRKLIVIELWLRRLFVSLDKDLANPYRTTAIPQTLLHGLASPHNGDTADLALELNTFIVPAYWGANLVAHYG